MTARLSPQREAETTADRRADLLVMLLHGGAATNSIATYIVDALVTAVRAESAAELAAVRAERDKIGKLMATCGQLRIELAGRLLDEGARS